MANEGVAILLALYSRLKPPPTEAEREELLKFFKRKEEEDETSSPMPMVQEKDRARTKADQ